MVKDVYDEDCAAVHFKDAKTSSEFMAFVSVDPPTRPKNVYLSFDTANGSIQMELKRKDLKRLINAMEYVLNYRQEGEV